MSNNDYNAGQALAASRGKTDGNLAWLVAPFLLAPFVAICYPVATAAGLAVAFAV